MRRTWLRGRENVHKRYLLHVAGHNLSLLMRQLIGAGTPREAVAGGYGGIFVLLTPTGAMLVALGVSQSGQLGGNRPWGMREKKTSLEGDLAVIHRRGGFGGRRGVAVHRRRAVAVRLVEKLDPAAGD